MVQKVESKKGPAFLTVQDLKENNEIVITQKPVMTKTKYGEKLFAIVKISNDEERTYAMNNTSMNHLIDKFGEDESKWIGKKVKMTVVKQATNQGLKDVIYPEGAIV